ncbi:hypothetical protein QUF58_14060 [Anaerolineales bacterium HSG24]|nr:hypothetical protein [Anaerolineales bacterium HSG24]
MASHLIKRGLQASGGKILTNINMRVGLTFVTRRGVGDVRGRGRPKGRRQVARIAFY